MKYTYIFLFLVSISSCIPKAMIPKGDCSEMITSTDKYTGAKTVSPVQGKRHFIEFQRWIDTAKKTDYYTATFNASSSYFTATGKGLYIKFSDSSVMNFPEERMNVTVGGYGSYDKYWILITLTKDQLQKFATVKVSDYKVYIYDIKLEDQYANAHMKHAKCLLDNTQL